MRRILYRPGLDFIASLPTLCIKEETYKNTVLWKIELPKPVAILYGDYPVLNTFWVEIITEKKFDNEGWHSSMLIGIKRTKSARTYIIPPHTKDFYVKIKWWNWYT